MTSDKREEYGRNSNARIEKFQLNIFLIFCLSVCHPKI
jgi:hypothetical protein